MGALYLFANPNISRFFFPFVFGQKDLIEEGSVMCVKGGKAIVPNVMEAVELARRRGILVVWVLTIFALVPICPPLFPV